MMENNLNDAMGQVPPKNYLVESILATIFCCPPLGIVAILSANKVNTLWATGDVEGSNKASEDAKKWLKYTIISWGVLVVVGIIVNVITWVIA